MKMITEQLIKRQSGEYDCEVVQRLNLENFGLLEINHLDNCIVLNWLSLAKNEISAVSGMSCLTNLVFLDLSFNRIEKIENLDALIKLESIDLRKNMIRSVENINSLANLPVLRTLSLRDHDGSNANPACSHPAYCNVMHQTFPRLEILDGNHADLERAGAEIEAYLTSISPSPDVAVVASQPDSWFSSSDLDIDAEERGLGSGEGSLALKAAYEQTSESAARTKDMLSEDCSYLLRQAQSAISKSQVADSDGSARSSNGKVVGNCNGTRASNLEKDTKSVIVESSKNKSTAPPSKKGSLKK